MAEKRRGIGFAGVLLGFALAFPAIALAGLAYLRYGNVPVATADTPFPDEKKLVHIALNARVDRQTVASPLAATPENLVAGAHVYAASCAVCHGTPGLESSFGKWEYPTAPQLWKRHGKVVGVSDDPVGETYWKVANGIRLTGMPSFNHLLTEPEMWQVSLLLARADKTQLPAVTEAFSQGDALRRESEAVRAAGSAGSVDSASKFPAAK